MDLFDVLQWQARRSACFVNLWGASPWIQAEYIRTLRNALSDDQIQTIQSCSTKLKPWSNGLYPHDHFCPAFVKGSVTLLRFSIQSSAAAVEALNMKSSFACLQRARSLAIRRTAVSGNSRSVGYVQSLFTPAEVCSNLTRGSPLLPRCGHISISSRGLARHRSRPACRSAADGCDSRHHAFQNSSSLWQWSQISVKQVDRRAPQFFTQQWLPRATRTLHFSSATALRHAPAIHTHYHAGWDKNKRGSLANMDLLFAVAHACYLFQKESHKDRHI